MRCFSCNATDKWENVDWARVKPAGMSICKNCGTVSYPEKWMSEEEIKEHYRKSYRPPPTHLNVFTGERKNHFHHHFLNDLFKKWKNEDFKNPKVCEIGAAFGMTLNLVKQIFPDAEVYGTELTTSFRRNAFHEFGITLSEDIDESKKYDLIMSYKVLEHQLDPDKCLEKYRNLLTKDGLLYISVPTWFNCMTNFGLNGFDIEYYYDPNHVNVWTREKFENILARSGFEIIKSDYLIYGDTYLCKPNVSLIETPILKEDVNLIKLNLEKIKDAYLKSQEGDFDGAIKAWSDYPVAHIQRIEFSRKLLHEKGWEWFRENLINSFINSCKYTVEPYLTAADFALRAEKFTEAIDYCHKALVGKPENPPALHYLMIAFREMAMRTADQKEKLHYFSEAREVSRHLKNVSLQHFKEATDLIFLFNSKLPFEGENKNAN